MSIHLMHVTTVPQTLHFFHGQVGYLMRHGFELTVVSSPGPALERFAALEGVRAVAVPMSRRITPLADLVSLWRLVRVFLRHKPDIVHSHTPKAALLGTIAARLTGRRVVLSIFGLPQVTRGRLAWLVLNGKTRLECALAHRVWCDSFSNRDVLIAGKLCRGDKIVVLGHGSVGGVDAEGVFNPDRFPADRRRAGRRSWHIPPEATVIGYVGRIVRDKGINELGRAWEALRARCHNLHLLLVGDPEPTDPIDPKIDSMLRADARVHFTGHQDEVAPLFALMDLYVMPSHREGFGVSNLEAAALALPVVATRIPGCVDSVADGVTGTLVPPHDAEALAEAIVRYLDDPALRRRHGDAGRQRVLADFVPQRIWSELAHLYHAVLPGRSANPARVLRPFSRRGPAQDRGQTEPSDRREGVVVVGAGGHAKVVISTLAARGIPIAAVFDDDAAKWGTDARGTPVSRTERERGGNGIIGIGDNARRRDVARAMKFEWQTVVHPSAWVDPSATLGRGTVVCAGAIVQADAVIGEHVIVNTGATIDHDCFVEDYAHLAPGVHLAGAVHVGEGAFLGTGSVVIPGVRIGRWSTLGAGAVAIRDVRAGVVAVGVPAAELTR